MKKSIPPRSPWSLIQEDLWPNEWKILVSCILLNRTTRKQVEKVINNLFIVYPNAQAMSVADPNELAQIVAPIGFKNRRARTLILMSQSYLTKHWKHAKELPGIGDYGAAAWEMFCNQSLPENCPKDGALTRFWFWRSSLAF